MKQGALSHSPRSDLTAPMIATFMGFVPFSKDSAAASIRALRLAPSMAFGSCTRIALLANASALAGCCALEAAQALVSVTPTLSTTRRLSALSQEYHYMRFTPPTPLTFYL